MLRASSLHTIGVAIVDALAGTAQLGILVGAPRAIRLLAHKRRHVDMKESIEAVFYWVRLLSAVARVGRER